MPECTAEQLKTSVYKNRSIGRASRSQIFHPPSFQRFIFLPSVGPGMGGSWVGLFSITFLQSPNMKFVTGINRSIQRKENLILLNVYQHSVFQWDKGCPAALRARAPVIRRDPASLHGNYPAHSCGRSDTVHGDTLVRESDRSFVTAPLLNLSRLLLLIDGISS